MSSSLANAPVIFPKPAAKDPDEVSMRSFHVLESMRRHRIVGGLTLLVCLLAGGSVLYKRRGPTFEASSQIYVSPTSSKALTEDKQQAAPYDGFVEEQVKTVTRYDVLEAALRSLPQATWQEFGLNETVAINVLSKLLTVARIGQTFEVKVSLDGSNARNVADIVNAVTSAYIAKARSVEFYDRDQKLAILNDQQQRLEAQLTDKGRQQTGLLQDLGIGSVRPDDASPYNEQLATLRGDLNTATEQLSESESKLEALRRGGANAPGMQVAAADASSLDAGLNALKANLSAQRGTLVQQMATLMPSNPIYKQDQVQLQTIDSQIAQSLESLQVKNTSQITQRLLSEIAQKQIVVTRLRSQLLGQTHVATGSAPKYQRAQQMSADMVHLQADLAMVQERIRELEVDSTSPGSVYLSASAQVPLGPAKSKFALLALILLVMSAGFSVLVTVAIDFFDPRLYSADDVKQVMGFSPLGVLLDHDHFSAEVSQQYLLRLAAGIHHAVRASGARTFLFTATEPESGTTTVVEKLAKQLRVLNLRTLTVAATNVDGKISYVHTSSPVHDTRRAASPAGTDKMQSSSPASLIVGNQFGEAAQTMFSGSFVAQVLAENENNYDVVLVDGGPLLISADTEYLARIADGTIIVAQSGRTTRKQLERSASLLERLHVPGVAIALNRVHPSRADAALRQDVVDFEQQLKKQRGTGLSRQYTRRIPTDRAYAGNAAGNVTGNAAGNTVPPAAAAQDGERVSVL